MKQISAFQLRGFTAVIELLWAGSLLAAMQESVSQKTNESTGEFQIAFPGGSRMTQGVAQGLKTCCKVQGLQFPGLQKYHVPLLNIND